MICLNAFLQDRIVKVVYLVSSLVVNISRPILIISPCAFLSVWEAEFLRLAASINVVVYGGSRDARNIIRSVEFYEGGNIMLQVLLSNIEVVSEDLNLIKGIQWEAVIVDDCQQSCVMEHCGSIKSLVADWRLLLVNAQLKEDVGDYINVLSLLESGDNSNQDSGPIVDSSVNINILKGRLSQFICCAKFLEYWVPVQISNLQLEQYCSLILSNRTALLSSSKSDPVGSLRDILISTRKCCDHPYIVDRSLQASLIGGLTNPTLDAVLDLGTRASGKLTLLDEILSEFRNLGLKVLILFQSVGGSGRDSKGDILDDFLRLRFGSDSYEHVDSGCLTSKKLAALNKFNKEKERSFFLLETRACLPSIKLSLLDAVIIFDSDWNPLNDLRALQKITIDSKLEQIKVFRLYCTCTVEEKVLILAKNDMSLDSTLQGISPSTSHMFLMWGSTYLFTRLDEFHQDKVADCKENIVPENSFMKHVCAEILSSIQNQETVNSSKFISVARQNGGGYLKNVALIGEQKIQLEDGIPSHLFWMKLLEGKQPQWRYLSGSSQRNRKRVHYQELGDPGDEDTKKSRKMERTKVDSSWQQPAKNMEKSNAGKKGSQENLGIGNNVEAVASANLASHYNSGITLPTMANDIPGAPQVNCVEPDDRKNLYNEQWGLFQMLKPAVSRLSETLHLKDDGKRLAEQFLEYVLKNHRVMAEPEAILQAFQISVDLIVSARMPLAGMDVQQTSNVDPADGGFKCPDVQPYALVETIQGDPTNFLRREVFKISNSSNDSVLATIGVTSGSKEHCIEVEGSSVLEGLDKQILSLTHMTDNKNDTWRFVKKVKKKCDKHVDRLKEKHNDELERFERECEGKRAELEKKYKMESAIICSIHGKSSVGLEKLKIMDKNCAKEREDLEFQISNRRKELEARQQAEGDEEQKKTANWLEQVKSLVQNELLDSPTSENDKQLQSAQQIDWEPSNASASVNRDNLVNIDTDRETPQMNGQDITSEVTVSEVPCLATDEQRVNRQNDDSINSLKDMPSSEEAGLNNMDEKSCHADLPKMQAVPIAETVSDSCGQVGPGEHPCAAPSREMEKNNNVMEPLEIHRSAVLQTNHVNDASASLSTKPLPSPGISLTKRLVADPAVEAPSMSQGIGDESCRDMADGADKQVKHVAGMLNVSPGGETTSLVCSDLMPCTLSPNAGVGGLHVAEGSVPESIVALTHSNDQTRAVAGSRADNQSGEIHTSVDGTVARIQPDHCVTNSGEHVSRPLPELAVDHTVNANLGQFETHTATTRGTSPARASRPNHQVPIFAISRSSDPLQNELERICKEIDEVISIHEETKLRLGSERDKEIEEVVAQIRKKYDEKIKEIDISFMLKRNELEMNQNKVMMHKILAEAFRSKCMDYRAASGMQQAIPSGSMEHVSQMQSATTTSTSGSFSAILPTMGPHSAAPTARAVQSSLAIASSPRAHPQIHPLAPASGLQVRSTIRAPAPHLQSFRSASVTVSTSYTPSVSCGVSVQQSSLSKSFSAPLFPARPPSQPSPMPLPALLNSHDRSHQAGRGGSTSAPLSLSVTELLMENGMQNETNVCCFGSFSSPLPDNVQNSRSQDIAQVETTTNLQMPSSGLGAGNNVVCLSDDE
ncbi:hypothetical protein Cgig2_025805 [Carnegiea gigantea]|uniref:Helicase C-terminal domain-containing protein n=1 Tax=Carnegiea gigantea TaxID=171969 RepID=A0A9Q1KE19_9CARY|nr:hypothetical protein Cgig2_025805 [Carnegiea gigantea]